jgi:hypothetical protein
MFPQPYVPSALCSSALCSLSPVFPQPYVPSALCSLSPMFPQPYIPSALCSLNPVFPQPYVPSAFVPSGSNEPIPIKIGSNAYCYNVENADYFM